MRRLRHRLGQLGAVLACIAAVASMAWVVAVSSAGAQDAAADTASVTIVSADASQFPIVDVLVQGPRHVNIEQINLSQDGIEVPTRLIDVAAPDAAVVVAVDPALGPEIGFASVRDFASALDPAVAIGIQAGEFRAAPMRDRVELATIIDAAAESWATEAPTLSLERTVGRGENLATDYADQFDSVELVVFGAAADFDPLGAAAEIEARNQPRAVVRLVFPDELVERYGSRALIEALVGPDGVAATGFIEPDEAQHPAAAPTAVADADAPALSAPQLGAQPDPTVVAAARPQHSTRLRAIGIAVIATAVAIATATLIAAPNTRGVGRSAMDQVMGGADIARSAPSDISAGIVAVADRVLGRSERTARLGPKLERAGIPMRPTEFLVVVILVTMAATLVGLSFLGSAFFLAPMLCLVAVSVVLQRMTNRRREKFADQLPGLLASMSGSLRSGNSLLQVLNQASQEVAAPARDELQRVLAENRLGRDLAEALRASVERMEVDDYRWVVEAIDVNRSTGGDLTSVLDNVEETIRDRAAIGRQVKALTAEGRISAKMLSILPFAMYGWQSIMNPEMAGVLLRTPMGRMVGAGALALMAVGTLWMRKIAQLKF